MVEEVEYGGGLLPFHPFPFGFLSPLFSLPFGGFEISP
jgi:hypothetical protein